MGFYRKAVKPCPEFLFLLQASVFLVACSASDLHLRATDQIRSVAHSCLTLCDPMNHSTPGLPVHHQLPEFTQTYVHRVSDAIQPSHPLSYCCASLWMNCCSFTKPIFCHGKLVTAGSLYQLCRWFYYARDLAVFPFPCEGYIFSLPLAPSDQHLIF